MPIFLNKKIIFHLTLTALLFVEGFAAIPTETPFGTNDKLRQPLEIMYQLADEGSTVRVLVTLQMPSEAAFPENWQSPKALEKLRDKIASRQSAVLSSLEKSEFKVGKQYRNFTSFSGEATISGVNKLVNNPLVRSVEIVQMQQPLLAQGISLINADIPRVNYNGQGVSIAICDTGIDYTHPKLGNGSFPNSKVIGGYDAGGAVSSINDPDPDPFPAGPGPDNAHGTNCAGIAAGNLGTVGDYIGGVAYGARIYALKITADNNNGAAEDDVIDAWDWCISHKNDDPNNPILIISYSFGSGKYTSPASAESDRPAMALAADNVALAGITLVAASGNDGYCDSIAVPAAFTSVISVGAVYDAPLGSIGFCIDSASCARQSNSGCTSGWACFDGSAADMVTCYSNTASFLDILAPSHDAYTTDIAGPDGYSSGDYETQFGGTSAACPYAAGAVACLQSAAKITSGGYLSPATIKNILASSGDNITDTKVSITKPRINLLNAIASLEGLPEAFDANVTTLSGTPVTISLQAIDHGIPTPLSYRIVSLPNHGTLADVNEVQITSTPYTLTGSEVIYTPALNCKLAASFNFIANDGGTIPDGGDSNTATVTVSILDLVYSADMDSDPGWAFDNHGSKVLWEYGVPEGKGGTGTGSSKGNPDPTTGHTGTKVIGYDLSGDYGRIQSTEWATTPAINCSGLSNVTLTFYRWLNVEQPAYDHAYIEVSNDGAQWNTIWQNSEQITDSSWSLQTYDISAFADDQQTVYIRWGMGTTDRLWNFSGWNIDDVQVLAASPVHLTGDFEFDCDVDSSDLMILLDHWLGACPDCHGADLAADGKIDMQDLSIFAQSWLQQI